VVTRPEVGLRIHMISLLSVVSNGLGRKVGIWY
jgi:hypothetical protein